jgi:protein-tyrosine kinase
MAKFRGSKVLDAPTGSQTATGVEEGVSPDRLIGEILGEKLGLSAEQVNEILSQAREKGIRFGDAAVAAGLASQDDVLRALAEQFRYPYATEDRRLLSPELVALNQPFSFQAEAFRAIRTEVIKRVFVDGEQRRALAVVSPASGDGKTFFCANLAISFAQVGGRTLLIDADLRGPRQHEVFGVSNSAGLSSLLAGHIDSQVIQQVPGVPSLFVMPVGTTPPNPLELVERSTFDMLLRELKSKFDHVIVDTPAAIFGVDAHVVAARCGAALIVARKDESRVGALQQLVATLSETPVRVVGVVFNEY